MDKKVLCYFVRSFVIPELKKVVEKTPSTVDDMVLNLLIQWVNSQEAK